MTIPRLTFTLLSLLPIIIPSGNTCGQSKNDGISVHEISANEIKFSINSDNGSWSKGKPAYVVIRIENTSGKNLEFWESYYFYLKSRSTEAISGQHEKRGQSYWSPAGIVTKNGKPVFVASHSSKAIRMNRTTWRFQNEWVRLKKGESLEIKVDLTQLRWQDRLSGAWPDKTLFETVPKGEYLLELELGGKTLRIVTDPVRITVE